MPCRARWCSETEELTTGSANPVDGRSRLASPVAMAVVSAEPDWTLIVVPAVIRYCVLDGCTTAGSGTMRLAIDSGAGAAGAADALMLPEAAPAQPIASSAATMTVTRRGRCPDSPTRMVVLQDRRWSSPFRSTLSRHGKV